jgi:ribosome-binding protein aMBF1 (putative translation factor)
LAQGTALKRWNKPRRARRALLLIVGRRIVINNASIVPVIHDDQSSELKAFGLVLRTYRQRAGLSQEALAHVSGLHRTYVGSVERGERNVSLLNIHVLAGALGIRASELIRGAEDLRQKPKLFRRSVP